MPSAAHEPPDERSSRVVAKDTSTAPHWPVRTEAFPCFEEDGGTDARRLQREQRHQARPPWNDWSSWWVCLLIGASPPGRTVPLGLPERGFGLVLLILLVFVLTGRSITCREVPTCAPGGLPHAGRDTKRTTAGPEAGDSRIALPHGGPPCEP